MPGISFFHKRMQEVKQDLLKMAGLVEDSIYEAVTAFQSRDVEVCRRVVREDRRIDMMQNHIEERAITLLATQQPVAVDLRFLAAVIKITSFLERMGDQAVNVAQRGITLSEFAAGDTPTTLLAMSEIAREMVRQCLDAFVNEDVALAEAVLKRDDDLDNLNKSFLEEMIQWMNEERRLIRRGVEFVLASRHLERIGDEATNIAEEVVFLVEGKIIRHMGRGDVSVGPL